MNFEKKLVILTGKTGKGTALMEQNGMGTFVTLNAFELPDLMTGEYAFGVKTEHTVFRREIGSLGRIKLRFALPEGDYTAAHLVLFRTFDEEVVLYGTGASHKMWEGNLMDGFRRKEGGKQATDTTGKIAAPPQDFQYSERKIEDYFLDIDASRYYDGALAEVNYFDYSSRGDREKPERYYEVPPMPSQTARQYLVKRFGDMPQTNTEWRRETVAAQSAAESADSVGTVVQSFGSENVAEVVAPKKSTDDETHTPPKIKNASSYTVEQAVAAVKTDAGFYATVKPQIDNLFAGGERFAPLEKALPGTRWIKADYDDSGKYYVVGLVGTAPDYIAYGVPGVYTQTPVAFEDADFIPLSAEDPTGDGFWVLFQSAETGKEIRKKA